jgi:hypothetical protein
MILRRLMNKLRQQNWVGLSLELIVLVVGVFLGLQIDDWNEGRKERVEEARILAALALDVDNAINYRQAQNDAMAIWQSNMLAALDILFEITPAKTLSDDQCFAVGKSHIIGWQPVSLVSVDELLAAGKLGLLRDARLRTKLLEFRSAAFLINVRNRDTGLRANVLVDLFPHLLPRRWTSDHVIWTIECDLDAMKSDQAFLNSLQSNYGRSTQINISIQTQLAALIEIKALLGEGTSQ